MAKMRVHELAKELEIKSADVVQALSEKGIEVKATSSIEDDNINYIRETIFTNNSSKRSPFTWGFFLV